MTTKKVEIRDCNTIDCKKNKIKTKNSEESLTNQSLEESLNIKTMLNKFGCIPQQREIEPLYGIDLSETLDIQERYEMRARTKEYFETLPAKTRKEFNDNCDLFIENLKESTYDDFYKDKLYKLGIIKNVNDIKTERVKQNEETQRIRKDDVKDTNSVSD